MKCNNVVDMIIDENQLSSAHNILNTTKFETTKQLPPTILPFQFSHDVSIILIYMLSKPIFPFIHFGVVYIVKIA